MKKRLINLLMNSFKIVFFLLYPQEAFCARNVPLKCMKAMNPIVNSFMTQGLNHGHF